MFFRQDKARQSGKQGVKRAVVGMSGGVDSSVTALFLKEQGYDVIGITLQLANTSSNTKSLSTLSSSFYSDKTCCGENDAKDALMVCEKLGVRHYVLDYTEIFQKEVVDDFVRGYQAGETPLPCVRCNEKIKFCDLLNVAKELDADFLATGHYVTTVPYYLKNNKSTFWALYTSYEQNRDQSYFLFTTTMEQLSFLRFPLGDFKKERVRHIAKEYGLTVANKKDSQDICFVQNERHYTDIIHQKNQENTHSSNLNVSGMSKNGPILYEKDGQILGEHQGIFCYTIGQRHGLNVSSPSGKPLYVTHIDPVSHTILVGPRSSLFVKKIKLSSVNWIPEFKDDINIINDISNINDDIETHKLYVKVRSMQKPVLAHVHFYSNRKKADVIFDTGEYGVSKGQACVFYDREDFCGDKWRVLGGGWITYVHKADPCSIISPDL